MIRKHYIIIIVLLIKQFLHDIPIQENIDAGCKIHNIFHSKSIISLIHLIGKHQLVAHLHTEFLCRSTGYHDFIFLVGGHYGKIRIVIINPQHCHIQIIPISFLFQILDIRRYSSLRDILRRIFIGIHISIFCFFQTGVSKIDTQYRTVYGHHQDQQADEHTDHNSKCRTYFPQHLSDLESEQKFHIPQIHILYSTGFSCRLLVTKQ